MPTYTAFGAATVAVEVEFEDEDYELAHERAREELRQKFEDQFGGGGVPWTLQFHEIEEVED